MKYTLTNVKSVKRSGVSKKTGNEYSIDMTELSVNMPVNKPDQFGSVSKTYNFGDSTFIKLLEPLRGKLPCEVELVLADELNAYDSIVTVVKDVKHPLLNKSKATTA